MKTSLKIVLPAIAILLAVSGLVGSSFADDVKEPADLAKERTRYTAELEAATKKIQTDHVSRLKVIQKNLMTAGDLDGALLVRDEIKAVGEAKVEAKGEVKAEDLKDPQVVKKLIIGKWKFSSGVIAILSKDGQVHGVNVSYDGTWSVRPNGTVAIKPNRAQVADLIELNSKDSGTWHPDDGQQHAEALVERISEEASKIAGTMWLHDDLKIMFLPNGVFKATNPDGNNGSGTWRQLKNGNIENVRRFTNGEHDTVIWSVDGDTLRTIERNGVKWDGVAWKKQEEPPAKAADKPIFDGK